MCGIFGTSTLDSDRSLARMGQLLLHRGPDDAGQYVDPRWGFGMGARRLSIIDVAGGHQPVSDESERYWCVQNGEIYNYQALRREMLERGHAFRSACDTEVLVHLYEEYGDSLVHALEGMYAFAIWDSQTGRLLLGRDRFGEKPLFYRAGARGIAFASELTALLENPRATEISAEALDAYFVFGYVPGPQTLIRDVRQLPPAHTLVWDAERRSVEINSYWRPPPRAPEAPVRQEDLVAETTVLLRRAVRSRLIADVPVGVFLSGGVDSSLIAVLAADVSPGRVRTFTVRYDTGEFDESASARAVANAVGAEHTEVVLRSADLADTALHVFAGMDQPLADQSLLSSFALAVAARRHVKVAVGGEGADEIFAGYPRYYWLNYGLKLRQRVPSPLLAPATQLLNSSLLPARGRRLGQALAPGTLIKHHLDWLTDERVPIRDTVYGPAIREHASGIQIEQKLAQVAYRGQVDPISRLMQLDQNHWLRDDVLVKADRSSMLASLEVRTPFLDRTLVEFAAILPVGVHSGLSGKRLLRGVLSDLLPGKANARPKTPFRSPVSKWLSGPLKPLVECHLSRSAIYDDGWFDRAAMRALYAGHLQGTHDYSSVLWPVLAFGVWYDRLTGQSDA